MLEALAMGMPVVATPLSADGIAVEHERTAVIASVEKMASEVVRVLNDAALQQTLSAGGRLLIKNRYSWLSVAGQYERLYQRIQHSKR